MGVAALGMKCGELRRRPKREVQTVGTYAEPEHLTLSKKPVRVRPTPPRNFKKIVKKPLLFTEKHLY